MKYELFTKLYGEALDYSNVELYIAERGWQDWMEVFDNVGSALKSIYLLAHSTLKESRERLSISRAEFSRKYNIPVRTLENWDAGINDAPEYVKMLIDYTILIEEENNMKNKLTVENLIASHYDNGFHELDFKVGDQTVFVRNIDVDIDDDEFYWDDEENVKKAVTEASDDDIEIV